MQVESCCPNEVKAKVIESIRKNSSLLGEGKHYEFAQKIKLLSHRRSQANKLNEAEMLLRYGSEEVAADPRVELNILNELLKHLVDLHQTHKELWNPEIAGHIHQIMNKRENPLKFEFYQQILKHVSNIKNCSELGEELLLHLQKNNQFVQAEAHMIEMPLKRFLIFLEKWGKKVSKEEYVSIAARSALLRGLFSNFDQSMVIMAELPCDNPFYRFADFLINSVQLESKESYLKIGKSYARFLETDPIYSKIYDSYGVQFFKMEGKKGVGIAGLLSF